MTTKTSEEQRLRVDEIDYIKAKKDFMKLVDHWLHNQGSNRRLYEIYSKENIDKVIQENKNDPNCHAKYEVMQTGKKEILILKKKNKFDPSVQILSWEEIFDLFMPLHVVNGHKGRDFLINKVGFRNFKYPSMCLTFFRRICSVCNKSASVKLTHKQLPKVALIYIINMIQMRSDEQFRYLMIYADKETNFVLLRPLMAKADLEISTELLKIFTQFGPPKRLHLHGYNETLTEKVTKYLREICPGFSIEVEHKSACYDLPTVVSDKIQEWMDINNSTLWEVGCCIVQRQMNNDRKRKPLHQHLYATPHSLYFHKNMKYTSTLNNRKRSNSNETNLEVNEDKKTAPIPSVDKSPKRCRKVTDIQNKEFRTSNFVDLLEIDDDSQNSWETDQTDKNSEDPIGVRNIDEDSIDYEQESADSAEGTDIIEPDQEITVTKKESDYEIDIEENLIMTGKFIVPNYIEDEDNNVADNSIDIDEKEIKHDANYVKVDENKIEEPTNLNEDTNVGSRQRLSSIVTRLI